jgi:hypothetical protein
VKEGGETLEAKEETPVRKDSVNEIADIEESVPNEMEEKNIDKQRFVLGRVIIRLILI